MSDENYHHMHMMSNNIRDQIHEIINTNPGLYYDSNCKVKIDWLLKQLGEFQNMCYPRRELKDEEGKKNVRPLSIWCQEEFQASEIIIDGITVKLEEAEYVGFQYNAIRWFHIRPYEYDKFLERIYPDERFISIGNCIFRDQLYRLQLINHQMHLVIATWDEIKK